MAQDNCAQGAPQGRCAHAPTGFRRLTPGLLRADRTAEGFAGLPEGVAVPGQLLAAFKAAAPHSVSRRAWCMRSTGCSASRSRRIGRRKPADRVALGADAAGGARPVADAGQGDQPAPDRARSDHDEGQPNGKRYGKRDPKGRIIEAYGFDLSPIAARYAEFRAAGGGGEGGAPAMGRLRRRATIARKAIVQILETAAEYSFDGRGVAELRGKWRH